MGGVLSTVYLERSEDHLQGPVLSFHHVGYRRRTQVHSEANTLHRATLMASTRPMKQLKIKYLRDSMQLGNCEVGTHQEWLLESLLTTAWPFQKMIYTLGPRMTR